jgi:sulfur-carrier protein
MAIVRLRGQLKQMAGAAEHTLDAPSVGDLLRALEQQHPALCGWILDERGEVRRHINVFVNGEPAEPDTAVEPEDKIEILPAISGG